MHKAKVAFQGTIEEVREAGGRGTVPLAEAVAEDSVCRWLVLVVCGGFGLVHHCTTPCAGSRVQRVSGVREVDEDDRYSG